MLKYVLSVTIAMAFVLGCNQSLSPDYHKLDMGSVSGKVMLEGKPLVGYNIIFQSEKGTFSYGKTDRNGEYRLMFNSQKEGVTKGAKVVRIRKRNFSEAELFPATVEAEPEVEATVSGDMVSVEPSSEISKNGGLPDVYHLKSHLRVDVEDTSQVFNFDLKADGSTTGPSQ